MSERLRLGKKPATEDARDLKFSKYVTAAALPTSWPKPNFGNGTLFKDWGVLGNDTVGDCVIASRAHLTMLQTKVGAPATAPFTTESVISEYSAVTGYDPADPNTDMGTDMRAMCAYQKRTGLLDASGRRHKIGAYLALEPRNPLEAMQAVWLFGGFCFGFSVPDSCFDQFDKGEIWDVVPGSEIVGGHEVCGVGTMDWQNRLTVVTWGRRQEMTFDFLMEYNDESWVYVDEEILNTAGTWRGLNISQLNADLAAL